MYAFYRNVRQRGMIKGGDGLYGRQLCGHIISLEQGFSQ